MQTDNLPFTNEGKVRYAFNDGIWFIKLSGAVCHPLGPTLSSLIDKALATPNSNSFVLDLTAADTIDSTCLGILTRVSTRPAPAGTPKPVIITGGGNIAKMILVVRFDRLFELVDSALVLPSKLHSAPAHSLGREQMLHLLLDAHQRLCAIDAQTHAAFRDVVEILEADALTH